MQKYLKIHTSVADLSREVLGFEGWAEWWPGIERVKVVTRDEKSAVLDLAITLKKSITMTMEVDYSDPASIRFFQRKGWFKHYEGRWELIPLQDGSGGTLLKITTILSPGAFVPRSMVYSALSHSLDLLEDRLRERLRDRASTPASRADEQAATPSVVGREEGEKAYLFPIRNGIEVWIRGRCYRLKHGGRRGSDADLWSVAGGEKPS